MEAILNSSNSDEECKLGGQTLAVSESDSENEENSRSIPSCNEKNDTRSTKVLSPIIGDVPENNSNLETNENQVNVKNLDNSENGISDTIQVVEIVSKSTEISLNSNSDDDSEHENRPKKSQCISYSDDEDIPQTCDSKEFISKNMKVQKHKKFSNIIDSESEEELLPTFDKVNSNNTEIEHKCKPNKISTIIDSESESNDEGNCDSDEHTKIENECDKKPRQQRASAKIALDTISAIKSETQRMHRENQVNVPYHKPRNCTLKEFMARKSQDVLKNVATNSCGKGLSLKMSEQELENYAKYLEKREQESQELFSNEQELIVPIMTTTTKEDNDSNEFKNVINIYNAQNDIINNNNDQNKTETSSKIEILSDILIMPPVITNETPVTPTLNITNLKKLIGYDKDFISSPTLQGDSKCIIDLESGDMIPSTLETTPKSGVDKLFERFLKSSGCKKRNNSAINSPNTTYNESTKLFNGNNSLIDDTTLNNNNKDRKPGASYVALKNNLRKIIFESRKTVLDKKINDFKIENHMVEQICAEEDEEEDYISESDEEQNQSIEKDINKMDENLDEENEEIDNNNADNSENEDINEDADDESDDSTDTENIRKKKSLRIIKRFEDDSDSDSNEYHFLNISSKESDNIEINKIQEEELLFLNISSKESDNMEINKIQEEELLELCSGNFDITQKQSEIKTNDFVIPTTQLATQFDESQLEALCSGTFADKVPTQSLNTDFISDEDESFKKNHNIKTTVNKISYSDDEDEEKNDDDNANTKSSDSYDDEEEQIETYVDFDSDENEIQVEMTKKDRKIKANEFVENEAELSESDWGSADEDEKDLDKYDIELGDEEQFDQEKLQSELGKIHMRKMMDEDARELKKMQELLFDDEENDGLGRQRQFRWRKTENGFDVNDDCENPENNKESDGEDDETEEQWRKMKHEREILLMEKQSLESNKVILSTLKSSHPNEIDKTNLGIDTTKFSINKSNKKNIDLQKVENDSPFLISKVNSIGIRGSFLKRDQEVLSKVAANLISSKEMNNNINSDSNDDIGRVKTTTGKYNNFVFTVLSQPQIQQSNKRKISDISDNNRTIKKTKLIPLNHKKNLIDHLDLTEI